MGKVFFIFSINCLTRNKRKKKTFDIKMPMLASNSVWPVRLYICPGNAPTYLSNVIKLLTLYRWIYNFVIFVICCFILKIVNKRYIYSKMMNMKLLFWALLNILTSFIARDHTVHTSKHRCLVGPWHYWKYIAAGLIWTPIVAKLGWIIS